MAHLIYLRRKGTKKVPRLCMSVTELTPPLPQYERFITIALNRPLLL